MAKELKAKYLVNILGIIKVFDINEVLTMVYDDKSLVKIQSPIIT
jgi:hypothetical protein